MIHNHEVESSSLSLATLKGNGDAENPKLQTNPPRCAVSANRVAQTKTGCSSARLEYTSGGRGVAGSNPVIPTNFEQTAGDNPAVFLFSTRLRSALLFPFYDLQTKDD